MNKKKAVVIALISAGVVFLSAFTIYAVRVGSFSPTELVSNILYGKPTQPPTQPPATVPPADPELEAKISAQTLNVKQDTKAKITAKIKGEKQNGYNIRYTTSDENIAYIDTNGNITPKSSGECQVGVYIEGYDNSLKNFALKVEDERISQIQLLNEYLFGLSGKEQYTYSGGRKGVAKITGCRIEDINKDGNYELILKYNLAEMFQKVFVVTTYGDGECYVNQSNMNFSDIVSRGYSEYTEDVYVDSNGNISIITESNGYVGQNNERTAVIYNVGSYAEQGTTYYRKEPINLNDITKKAEYKVNGEKKTRDEFTWQYTSLKSDRELFDNYITNTVTLSQGKYVKAELPSDIGEAYYQRMKWVSSDNEMAEVSQAGMITGRSKMGTCEVIGYIEGFEIPFCKVIVDVSDISSDFDGYVNLIKGTEIIGMAGNKMRLYGYYVADIDNDNVKDLLLYYVGGNGCQLEMAHYVGSQVSRQVIKSVVTENGTSCLLDLYSDNMNNGTVLYVGKVQKTDDCFVTEFHYENFVSGQFSDNDSSKYTAKSYTSGKNEYSVAGSEVSEESFNGMISRYQKLGSWKLV